VRVIAINGIVITTSLGTIGPLYAQRI
jgi:hypothetical protein